MYGVGRLVDNCPHPSGWDTADDGEERCHTCGTRRFTHYGALRPPGLPVALTPAPRDATRADRSAAVAISHTLYRRLTNWARAGAALRPVA
ncbi:DUF6255 family natural product biosynthesis protein [Streptomyces sp. UNOB3_S3]|uniref:DUF6255 family natural product biosynthesis protein n=1 Tax=Streptomyces sp. UNOB3_S3 TaxID=2871682 RepID=UPI001E5A9D61|nr:DUF6255 family natural product biosynthesis protein [Streptomyces sp. UNOB3_S3]MCC3776071.1 hypothetical protein [Streptomyces sp. UNOB3_S3]